MLLDETTKTPPKNYQQKFRQTNLQFLNSQTLNICNPTPATLFLPQAGANFQNQLHQAAKKFNIHVARQNNPKGGDKSDKTKI